MKAKSAKSQVITPPLINFELKRDAYGFAVRPQHVHRYREYANIYKEEEMERSDRWKDFLERQAECAELPVKGLSIEDNCTELHVEASEVEADVSLENGVGGVDLDSKKSNADCLTENVMENKKLPPAKLDKTYQNLTWTKIRPSLCTIEDMMSSRVKKTNTTIAKDEGTRKPLLSEEEARPTKGGPVKDSMEEFYDVDGSDSYIPSSDSVNAVDNDPARDVLYPESFIPWKEELECLVQGGVPMALRGELWQAFVGVRTRRVEKYYQNLLAPDDGGITEHQNSELDNNPQGSLVEESICIPEKWQVQIEKVIHTG